jgi:hypothetical protein
MARARVDRSHPVNVLAAIERLTEVDQHVLRLVAEHEVMSTEQLAAVCFPPPARFADAAERLRYLATRALLVRFPHPGTHPAGLPADELASRRCVTSSPRCTTAPATATMPASISGGGRRDART